MKAPRGLGPRKRGGAEAPYKHLRSKILAQGGFTPPGANKIKGLPSGLAGWEIHAENEYNNRCDELAVAESRKYK